MGGFYTIHITPEAHCSYVSFETNIASSDYVALVEHVLSIFKPKVGIVDAFHAIAFLCYFLFQL